MKENYKPGGGNKLQPYMPAGNGSRSGRYIKKGFVQFLISEHCLKSDLEKNLTKEELFAIRRYSDYLYGPILNKAIREGKLNKTDTLLKDLIVRAIWKHRLENAVIVYRGISVQRKIYDDVFYANYTSGKSIVGSTICSTSRTINRAISAARAIDSSLVCLIFIAKLPKGYHALPIEAIAIDEEEREVLLTSPRYIIENIKEVNQNEQTLKFLKIKIKEGENNEN